MKTGAAAGFGFAVAATSVFFASAALTYVTSMQTANTGSGISSSEWNAFIANFTALDSQLANTASKTDTALAAKVPTGAVMAFNLGSCPTGWSAFASANGRAVV